MEDVRINVRDYIMADMSGYAPYGVGMGLGIADMFSNWNNPASGAQQYLNQIPGKVGQYYNPYIQQGQAAYGGLNNQYNQMMNSPGNFINNIGSQYQQSPGFKFALQQALQGANQGAAAGGMAGSPQNQQQNMGIATNMANQDYYNWLNTALGQQNIGLQGEQGIYNTGYNASSNMANAIGNALAGQAGLSYAGQAAQNQHDQEGLGAFLGGLGGIAMKHLFG